MRSCFGGATLYDFSKIPATALYRGKDGAPWVMFTDFVSENLGATVAGVAVVGAVVVGSAIVGSAIVGSVAVGSAVVGAAFLGLAVVGAAVVIRRYPGHYVCEHVAFHEALGVPVYIQPKMLNVAPAMHIPPAVKERTDKVLKEEAAFWNVTVD